MLSEYQNQARTAQETQAPMPPKSCRNGDARRVARSEEPWRWTAGCQRMEAPKAEKAWRHQALPLTRSTATRQAPGPATNVACPQMFSCARFTHSQSARPAALPYYIPACGRFVHDAVLVGRCVNQGLDYNERSRSITLDRTANAAQQRAQKLPLRVTVLPRAWRCRTPGAGRRDRPGPHTCSCRGNRRVWRRADRCSEPS